MGGRGAGSGGGGKSIGFSAKQKNGFEMRVYSVPGSKTQVRIESRAGTTIQRVNGGINAMMKNAKNSGAEVKKITAKSEKQYQDNRKKARNELLGGMRVNGGYARMLRLRRTAMTRGRPDSRNGF